MKYSTRSVSKNKKRFLTKLSKTYRPISKNDKINKGFKNYLYQLNLAYGKASRKKEFITEPKIQKYFDKILDTILTGNQLPQHYEIILTRYPLPNAFNMGDHRLFVNIGLFRCVDNEAQLAFVIAHELSHKLMNHVEQNYIAIQQKKRDKKTKAELKNIKRAKYNKLDKAIKFIKDYNYDLANYSRLKEYAADSLAVKLLSNLGYDLSTIPSLFINLKNSDVDTTSISYSELFSSAEKKLSNLLTKENDIQLSFGDAQLFKLDEDSLRTHPNMENRTTQVLKHLKAVGFNQSNKKLVLFSQPIFDSLKAAADFEELELYKLRKRYSALVYNSLRLSKKYPEHTFLYKNVAVNLMEIYSAVQKHTIQHHIPIESFELSEAYNQLLRIIDRSSETEYKQLVTNYLDNYKKELIGYPEIQKIHDEIKQ